MKRALSLFFGAFLFSMLAVPITFAADAAVSSAFQGPKVNGGTVSYDSASRTFLCLQISKKRLMLLLHIGKWLTLQEIPTS